MPRSRNNQKNPINEAVLVMVREQLKRDRGIANRDLIDLATRIDPTIGEMVEERGEMGENWFQGTYRLRAAKLNSQEEKDAAGVTGVPARLDREAARKLLLDLMREVANVDSKGQVLEIVDRVDTHYLERLEQAVR